MANDLCRQVELAFSRLENLRQCDLPSQELASKLIEDLSLALQELQTSTEELLEQNNELASNRTALEEERYRYQGLFEFAPECYLVTDTEGIILDANSAATSLLNLRKCYLLGKPLALFINTDERSSFRIRLAQITNEANVVNEDWELVMLPSKGNAFPASITVGKVTTSSGKTTELRWLIRDITKRRLIEEELQKIDKLESLSILAGGVAHDLNNFLTVILGNLTLAKIQTKEDHKTYRHLKEMEKAIRQTGNLTGQLLSFATGGKPLTQAISVQSLIEEVSTFSLSGSNVSLELSSTKDLPLVEVDPGQITQVISNLLINADQAMEKGGTIKVRIEQLSTTEDEDALPLQPGSYISITITDEGPGIPIEHFQKIFDPYFSTKENGNGLGLTICYSIVKKHGGHISVQTIEGKGTSFTVYLPVSKNKANKIIDETLFFGEGKVLFMDDEANVRQTAGEILTFLGYDVQFASDGTQAIKLYQEAYSTGNPFDVVITDLTVRGGMGGKMAIIELLKINPHVKTIVSSGYSNDMLLSDYKKYGFCDVIAKPYKLQEMSEVLHRVIRERRY